MKRVADFVLLQICSLKYCRDRIRTKSSQKGENAQKGGEGRDISKGGGKFPQKTKKMIALSLLPATKSYKVV